MRHVVFGSIAVLVASGMTDTAYAASFACTKAASAYEHLICNTPTLSALDSELGQIYATKRSILSPAGAQLLQASQRSWLSYVQTVCQSPRPAGRAAKFDTPIACVNQNYVSRLQQLSQTGRFGPYVVIRVDKYATRTGSPERSGPDTSHTAYPQIDAPANAALRAWNRKAEAGRKTPQFPQDVTRENSDYLLGVVSAQLIGLLWTSFDDDPGMPRNFWSVHTWNSVLTPSLRDLSPSDLFDTKDGWRDRFADIALRAIERHGWKHIQGDDETAVRQIAGDPRNWLVEQKGLEIVFPYASVGCVPCAPHDGLVPWSDLRPILSEKAPIPD